MAAEIVNRSGNGSSSGSRAPHLLILPYPAQGHINPMLQFAKRLLFKGVDATVAITVFIANSLGAGADSNSSIHIGTYSDGHDQGGFAKADSSDSYLDALRTVGSKTLSDLIQRLREQGRPVDAVVYDGFVPWGLDVAKRFGLKAVLFFTQSCAVNSIYYHSYKGSIKLPLSEPTISLPGLPLLQSYEVPSFLQIYGSHPAWTYTVVNQFSNIDQADWILFNNFYELEKEEVDWFSKLWKVGVGTIGPTLPSAYLDKQIAGDKDYGINLLKPDRAGCISWLSDKPKGSVVYVSFGSMAELSEEQTAELAFGLNQADCYFLWVVRAEEERKLPEGFRGEKGLVVNWSPQLEVLAHESVGCFVSHCGLNSVFEGVCLGVPMVGIPQWTDQPVNAKYVEEIWRMGIRAWPDEDGIVRREVVSECIKEVMEGEKGKGIKVNAEKWKKLAREVIDDGGSSDKNINEFLLKLFDFSIQHRG